MRAYTPHVRARSGLEGGRIDGGQRFGFPSCRLPATAFTRSANLHPCFREGVGGGREKHSSRIHTGPPPPPPPGPDTRRRRETGRRKAVKSARSCPRLKKNKKYLKCLTNDGGPRVKNDFLRLRSIRRKRADGVCVRGGASSPPGGKRR